MKDGLIEQIEVSAYTIPTDLPEADGTVTWGSTTIVLVEATAAGTRSLGYGYADVATAQFICNVLAPQVQGHDALNVPGAWEAMVRAVRNHGRAGIASMAIAAVDNALWDLKARLLNLPLVSLLGAARGCIPAYGSGGFTSYTDAQLQEQLRGWVEQGMQAVKMKIGTHPEDDVRRVQIAREAIGKHAALYVDANGAYKRKQAIAFAERFAESDVRWFEEPVYHRDFEGLRLVRDHAPARMVIASGEYGYEPYYFREMLDAGAVDVIQADATRCEGVSGFLLASALCETHMLPLSAHTSPTLHAHLCCAVRPAINVEYFYDHARIEHLIFDGALTPHHDGKLYPDVTRPGLGLALKRADAEQWRVV